MHCYASLTYEPQAQTLDMIQNEYSLIPAKNIIVPIKTPAMYALSCTSLAT